MAAREVGALHDERLILAQRILSCLPTQQCLELGPPAIRYKWQCECLCVYMCRMDA